MKRQPTPERSEDLLDVEERRRTESDGGLPGQELRYASASKSQLGMVWSRLRRHRLAVASVFILAALALTSYVAPLLMIDRSPDATEITRMTSPPTWDRPFGTDDLGRDQFVRAIHGGQISLRIGMLAALVAVTIGTVVGAVAAYNQQWIDNVLMRVTDAFLSIPTLFILIVLTQVIGQSITVISIVIGSLAWMPVSRLVRANVLTIKQQDYVIAAHAIGARPQSVLFRHILPNTISPIVVAATLGVGQAILLEAQLSFLGLGIQPPTASWGNMLNRAQGFLTTAPWMAFFPGFLILLTVLCVNFLGDGLRDSLDPHSDKGRE